ncbi:MAG: ATP-grasp domain-containing protein, partial [Thermoleophilia bacterium]|nr:ATP-grasp domain-containing protein [Thermoleophilia bacterium]
MAESAARSGAPVVAVDFFGDRDQARAATSYALGRDLGLPLSAGGLVRAAGRLEAGAVVYGANLENHAAAIVRLARRHEVLGNEAGAVRKVRDWRVLRRFCAEAGIACPTTLVAGEEGYARETGGRWLRKRVRSGGGHGVRRWDGEPLDRDHLLQAEVEGRAASASFVADGRAARVFALGEQLIGDRALGAHGFAWCGNIVPFPAGDERAGGLTEAVAEMASRLTRRFRLRGVNGLDLVVAEGAGGSLVPNLVEVNPRVTASMELAERAYGVNVFALHLAGCAGRLPGGHPAERQAAGFF